CVPDQLHAHEGTLLRFHGTRGGDVQRPGPWWRKRHRQRTGRATGACFRGRGDPERAGDRQRWIPAPRGPVLRTGIAGCFGGHFLRRGVPVSQDVVAGQDPADEHTNRKRLRTVRLIAIGNLIALQILLLCVALLEAAMLAEGSAVRLMSTLLFSVRSDLVFLPMYRSRMEGRDRPEPWLFWGAFTCVVVAHLLSQSPFTAMLTLASWWAICVVLAPRRLAVVLSVVCALLPWALLGTFL